jgi:hypothetical protein
MLRSNGLDYTINPVMQVLRGIGVASILDNKSVRIASLITIDHANQLMADSENVNWILLNDKEGKLKTLMPVSELAKYLQTTINNQDDVTEETEFDLFEIPANRLQLSPISLQSNLQQAHEKFQQGAEALYVVFNEQQAENSSRIYGIITKSMVDASYKV